MTIRVIHGDCVAEMPKLVADGVVVDAICCDPPYGLEFMGVGWDTFRDRPKGKARPRNEWGDFGSREHPRGQHDIARVMATKARSLQAFTETWAREALQTLRPGGFLLAFGGTRTQHRMVCGLEDAGFVIQDTLAWMYATGFPKNKAHLKPAYEPIVLAYKPGGKRTLQVDECRIATGDDMGDPHRFQKSKEHPGWSRPSHTPETIAARGDRAFEAAATLGRWPANICHDGSDEVVALFPETCKAPPVGSMGGGSNKHSIYGDFAGVPHSNGYGDEGSAARFFFSAKAGTQDRWGSRHPTVKPVELMKWLVALVTPPGGTCLDPFAGSGTTGVAALATGRKAILIEREDSYIADIRERLAFYEGGGTHSVQAKNRNRKVDHGPLFAEAPLTPAELEADSLGSYEAAMAAIGERVKAGAPVPASMLSRKVAK